MLMSAWRKMPSGMKYMFTTLCLKPTATEHGDAEDDRENFVGKGADRHCKPDVETDENIAERAVRLDRV